MDYGNDINYTYDFQGRSYRGSCCNVVYHNIHSAEQKQMQYSPGFTLISVNPSRPYESRLRSETGSQLLFGVVFTIVGGVLCLAYIRNYLQNRKKPKLPQPPQSEDASAYSDAPDS